MKTKLILLLIVVALGSRHGLAQNDVWNQNGTKIYVASTDSVGIGTINPDSRLTLNGKIHTSEVLVNANIPVPDFVFKKDYPLLSLNDLEDYIKLENHLPCIPSAEAIEQNGIKLSEMTLNLLKKTEELTLYIIDHHDRLNNIEIIMESENIYQSKN